MQRLINFIKNGRDDNMMDLQSVLYMWYNAHCIAHTGTKMHSAHIADIGFPARAVPEVTSPPAEVTLVLNSCVSVYFCYCQTCRHWQHRKLSLCQSPLPPATTNLASWKVLILLPFIKRWHVLISDHAKSCHLKIVGVKFPNCSAN